MFGIGKLNTTVGKPNPNLIDDNYFKERTTIDPRTDCHKWNLRLNDKGQGECSLNIGEGKKKYMVSRIAYIKFVGPVEDGNVVFHTCTEKSCCNPKHLKQGTIAERNEFLRGEGRMVAPPKQFGNNYTGKEVIADGKKFKSLSQAGLELGITGNGVKKRILTGKFGYGLPKK